MYYHAPVDSLLEQALLRLRRQSQYARPLTCGGKKAKQLEQWLDCATDSLSALICAEAIYRPLNTSFDQTKVSIEEKFYLEDPALAGDLNAGGRLSTYLLTLGYDQADAFEQVERDYMIHHIQTELGREMLFALGRIAHQQAASSEPDRQLRRISILIEGQPECGTRLWDAANVQLLLSSFGDKNLGVSITDSGCFQPLHSLLGLVISRPAHTG